MTDLTLKQRARELLAAESERDGYTYAAWRIRKGEADKEAPMRAIKTALQQAQQPGAQAVVIPEPSGEDVDAAAIELCKRFDPSPSFDEWVSPRKKRWERYRDEARAALTTYTARLRERIGQAPWGDGDA